MRSYNREQYDIINATGKIEAFKVVEVPSAFQSGYMWDLEWPYTDSTTGPVYRVGYLHDYTQNMCTFKWEIQQLDGLTPTTSLSVYNYTNPWEAFMISTPAEPPPFHFPLDFFRLKFIAWDKKPLDALSLKRIEETDPSWKTRKGDPTGYYREKKESTRFNLYPIPSSVTWRTTTDFISNPNPDTAAYRGGQKASGTFEFTGSVSDGETVTIGDDIYEFDDDLNTISDPNLVAVIYLKTAAGAPSAFCAQRLAESINESSREPVTATIDSVNENQVIVTANELGSEGNSIATTDTVANGEWHDETLTGGDFGYIDVDNNILIFYEKNPSEITEESDESELAVYFRKYVEYGVLADMYGANTDGRIPSLSEYWKMRKEVALNIIKSFKSKRFADRDYQLETKTLKGSRKSRHPRLPDKYPSVYP